MNSLRDMLLYKAIIKRLKELEDHLSAMKIRQVSDDILISGVDFNLPDSKDYEENLRFLMVRYLPKIESKKYSEEDIKAVFYIVHKLSGKGITEDYRFLDAFNCTYEILIKLTGNGSIFKEYLIPFLNLYKSLLERNIKRLQEILNNKVD
jgi:hypothetical protein